MINDAFKAFIKKLQNEFPISEVEDIHLNWPGPDTEVVFPYMVVLTVNQEVQDFTPQLVKKNTDGSFVYVNGQWTSRIDVHYLSRRGRRDDQEAFIQKFTDLFQSDFIKSGGDNPTPSLILPFGTGEKYENATIHYLSWQLDQISSNIQEGERRSIFELLMDVPRIVTTSAGDSHTITDVRISADISEFKAKQPQPALTFSPGTLETFPNVRGKRQLENEDSATIEVQENA